MKKLINKAKNRFIELIIKVPDSFGIRKWFYAKEPRRFLVISTTGIGDTLFGTPAIRALRETYPGSHISVLTSPSGYELLRENLYIDSLFTFKKGWNNFFLLPRLLKSLRQKKFEVVFILHASDRIIFPLAFFTGTGRIIGISGRNKGLDFILTDPLSFPSQIHCIEERLALVKQVGADTKNKAMEIFLTEKEREWAKQFLKDNGINKDFLLIGMHPGSQKVFQRWPAQNFIETGNLITEKFKCKIIITGGSQEKSLVSQIASKIEDSVSVAGILSIRETAALIERMNLFITNDTGPMHIAFAVKTPTIALFASAEPGLTGPYYVEAAAVIKKPRTCIPCIVKNCSNPHCMEQITAEDVIGLAESFLKTKDNFLKKSN